MEEKILFLMISYLIVKLKKYNMKKSVLFIGTVLIMINSLFGLIIISYKPFNIIITDISLLLSVFVIYINMISKMPDGFKIGFSFLFSISGLIRFICGLLIEQEIKNNLALISFIVVLGIEFICIFVGNALKDK